MLPLAALSIYIYYLGVDTVLLLLGYYKNLKSPSHFEKIFSDFINSSGFKSTTASNKTLTSAEVKTAFAALRSCMLSGVNSKLKMLKILSGISPLLGLLGTVSGMMISISAASQTSSSAVSEGISKALITTQAGLSIAIPALIMALCAGSIIQRILVKLSKYESSLLKKGSLI